MSSTSQPLVSIVTPVYNEEQYLGECIESVLAQSYENWEYTIVDNCSTDASVDIARRYEAQDRRIRVHQNATFLQQMPNFNHALRLMSPASKYCKMVSGDDWLFPECVERMVDVAERHPSIGIVSAYALEGHRVTLTGLPYQVTRVDGRETGRRHLLDKLHLFGTQSSVLYRADLIRARDPFFSESIVNADTDVCFELLKRSDFGFVHQVLTFTRVRAGSVYTQLLALDADWAANLHLLMTHGPTYLTRDELQTLLERHVTGYYRFLGKSVLMRRDSGFWNYHRGQLIAAGVGYRRVRIIRGMLETIGAVALNPGIVIARLLKRHDLSP